MSREFDILVIGGGGGTKLVSPAAALGYSVAIIEEDKLGGTCLNHGCIPSKMLIHAADVAEEMRHAARYNLSSADPEVAFAALTQRVNQTTDADSDSINQSYANNPNIHHFKGRAQFVSDKVVHVNDEQITAKKIYLAVGAKAQIPDIEGLKGTPYWTYKEALRAKTLPKKLCVLGGGYIATELGYFYAAMGAQTTFFVRSQLLRREDKEVREEFARSFSRRYDTRLGELPTKITYDGSEFSVLSSYGEEHFDQVFMATGVTPNTEVLGLENTSIKIDNRGNVVVDEHLQTTCEGVFAFGDVIGRKLFRHTANFEGEYLFRQHYSDEKKTPIDYSPVPHAVFSNPQIGGVGKTEEELIAEKTPYFKGVNPYSASAMGMALRSEEGFCKLLFCQKSQKLLGAHIIGVEASNMIHMCIAYMNMGATLDDMLKTIYIHPALPEIVRNAARMAKGNL